MDISINNPKIRNFLTGKTDRIPEAELYYLFSNSKEKSFLEDIKNSLVSKSNYARQMGKPMRTFAISEALVVIVRTSAVFLDTSSSEEEKKEAVNEAASAIKFLWTVSSAPSARSKSI